MCDVKISSASHNDQPVPAYNKPLCLKIAAATVVVRLLIYEDDSCEFYKWDPVRICQFEPPARRRRRKSPHDSPRHVSDEEFPHPPSPWNGIKRVRDWWDKESNRVLGGKVSPARKSIAEALERQSWCSTSDEEDVLFFLLSLCIDPYPIILSFEEFNEEKCDGLRRIINSLGPYPTETLIITHNVDFRDTKIIETILKHAPDLEIVHVPYFVISSEFLKSLRQCQDLVEFSLYGMCSRTFFSEDPFYRCFFNGLSPEVVKSHDTRTGPLPRSFEKLKLLNFTEYDQTFTLIDDFYRYLPGVSIGCLDLCGNSAFDKSKLEIRPFQNNPHLRIYSDKSGLFKYGLPQFTGSSDNLKELLVALTYDDNKERNDEIVNKLKEMMKNSPQLSSFGFAPADSMSVISYVVPVLSDYGKNITTLDVAYCTTAEIHVGLLFQVLNSCPNLMHLFIGANFLMTDSNVTNDDRFPLNSLKIMRNLETFVLHGETAPNTDGDVREELLIGNLIINSAKRLKCLSFAMGNKLLNMEKLQVGSVPLVSELHIVIRADTSYDFNTDVSLAPFPNLKVLSVEAENNRVNFFYNADSEWVKRSQLLCTGKRPTFVRNQFKYGPGQDFPEPKINLPDLFVAQ